ncbi:MAG: hypothetical protein OEY93_07680 [Anaerolineae bacterium]|nr:hypothetical protein [Anaerolineae bacterium]
MHDGTQLCCLTGDHLSSTSLVLDAAGALLSVPFLCRRHLTALLQCHSSKPSQGLFIAFSDTMEIEGYLKKFTHWYRAVFKW